MRRSTIDRVLMAGFLGIAIWTYISGALCDVIDVDAAQYATISMEMLQNDTFLTVTESGKDYLDKPPFLFWLNCISFSLFGFTNFAYKLPSLLFSLLGLFYTYKLGAYLFDRNTGKVAAILVGTSIGFFWVNNDVKTDAIVTACFVFSLYQLILFTDRNKIKHLIFGSIGIGVGMLTKGPLGLVFPLAAVFIHLTLKQELKKLLRVSWILLPVIVAIILLPMCIGLYNQFDLHPEKVVNGETGVSGLRFFFWEQSFGRITGENRLKNDTSFFYLFGSFLVLVFPFSALTILAYFKKLKKAVISKYDGEYYLLGGSLLILTLLSFSTYKIPHYAIVVLPLVGILVAHELIFLTDDKSVRWLKIHNMIVAGVIFALSALSFLIFDFKWIHLLIVAFLLVSYIYYHLKHQMQITLFIAALTLGFVLNAQLIPGFQKYSEGRRFAELIKENDLQDETLYFFNRKSKALEFYLQRYMEVVSWEELIKLWKNGDDAWFYMSLDGKEALQNSGLQIEEELGLMHYNMNRIKPAFLNPKTRQESLEHRFLIKFKPE